MGKKIEVLSREVRLVGVNDQDYVCLTDIARYKDSERTDYLISNWLRNRNTVEFLGIWEQIYNPGFNPIEFDGIRNGANLLTLAVAAFCPAARVPSISSDTSAPIRLRQNGRYPAPTALSTPARGAAPGNHPKNKSQP
jgi:hypothetical protein